jgi:L-threonate 2-dehydrogenase
MSPTVAIVAQGTMGAAVARRLVDHGVVVLTALEGRGAASKARATAAGMRPVADDQLVDVDLLLSIVPPASALPFARRMAPLLFAAPRKPLFVDCNAVSPQTVLEVAAVIAPTGAEFADVGIIGMPPGPGVRGPNLYASGEHAREVETLSAYGLDVRLLDGPIGAASALKMCYAGITKGITAVASCMILAAQRAGSANALHAELVESQPMLMAAFTRNVPGMYPKAYRWVAEMQEIARFAELDSTASEIFTAAARLYDRIAKDFAGARTETTALSEFLTDSASAVAKARA